MDAGRPRRLQRRVASRPDIGVTSAPRAIVSALVVGCTVAACAKVRTEPAAPSPSPSPTRTPAPWSVAPLDSASVPATYHEVWRVAENRASCALLAPGRLDAVLPEASPARAATFSGGWGVAYDTPQVRSAFGIAGAGVSAWSDDIHDEWPHRLEWSDGSRAGYGPEGGAGPNWLAYLRIPGQDCLYNVWSRQGRSHLEALLGALRFVATR